MGAVRLASSSPAIVRTAFSISATGGSPDGSLAVKGTKRTRRIPSAARASATASMRVVCFVSSSSAPSVEAKRRRTLLYVPVTRQPTISG